jgi:hypothetical protein
MMNVTMQKEKLFKFLSSTSANLTMKILFIEMKRGLVCPSVCLVCFFVTIICEADETKRNKTKHKTTIRIQSIHQLVRNLGSVKEIGFVDRKNLLTEESYNRSAQMKGNKIVKIFFFGFVKILSDMTTNI